MKEFTKDKKFSIVDDDNEDRSVESSDEEFVHGENALKGLIPQGANHFNPIDENDEEDDEMEDEELDDDLEEMDEDVDQDINNEIDERDSGTGNNGNQSDIPLEFPSRGPDRNYTTPQANQIQ